jgi:hypothetical protein
LTFDWQPTTGALYTFYTEIIPTNTLSIQIQTFLAVFKMASINLKIENPFEVVRVTLTYRTGGAPNAHQFIK